MIGDVLDSFGVRPVVVRPLKDLPLENSSWLVEVGDSEPVVLRRYHHRATAADLAYEHAVLRHVAAAGWVVPEPVSDLVQHGDRWYCLNRFVPGEAIRGESPEQRRRRGRDMARLDLVLRDLAGPLGQRPGWRTKQEAPSSHTDVDPAACLAALAVVDARRADWLAQAIDDVRQLLDDIGAEDLPVTVVHGDLAEWNMHYGGEELAGVIDFGLTHLDSRPYELAIARTWRAPEAVDGYCEELVRQGWPMSELELAAIEPIHCAFRLDMALWELDHGRRTGDYDFAMIDRQLARTGTAEP